MGAALAALLEKAQVPRLVTHQIAGILNVEADWLSRPAKQTTEPMLPGLLKVRDWPKVEFSRLGKHPELWGKDSDQQWCVFEHL